ncbi:MauE/DoxX family redox-associated membrane protein [Emticicia sp. 21SJ11W-3]|uniref:MauE/DoxX family redox-associated membrane protein n=1 Tax=Emticicia sp. 21SJ11W-3 TaxID=2916755 RepID=UPI00209D2608|nr:MauE/DoxX family redox-associated membrane protein [Emticicia sp. 21SJ11W-3]UTA67555.1 hypothetical protein MB380_18435 [Emticicia sp. 21SJ11W-3]
MKLKLLVLLLLTLWIPVTLDKLIDFEAFQAGILRQPFSDTWGHILIYTLPILEMLIVLFLLIPSMRYYGIWLSLGLMSAFTTYIGLALAGVWEQLPCGCGSVISGLSWQQHFCLNLFFTAVSAAGFYLVKLQRGRAAGSKTAKGLPA